MECTATLPLILTGSISSAQKKSTYGLRTSEEPQTADCGPTAAYELLRTVISQKSDVSPQSGVRGSSAVRNQECLFHAAALSGISVVIAGSYMYSLVSGMSDLPSRLGFTSSACTMLIRPVTNPYIELDMYNRHTR